jgi:class 3 adenylate cyclase
MLYDIDAMEQQTRFCTSADGTRIAYATVGEGPGLPILYVRPWPACLEKDWEKPEGRAHIEGMAEGGMLVVYDRRGVGLSQREVDEISLERQLADLTAVVDSLGLERFHLLGHEDGGALAVVYAAQHPERVSRLVLWAPVVYGADAARPEQYRSLAQLIQENWGLARREISRLAFPEGPIEWQRWLSAYLREAASSEVAARHIEWFAGLDVRSLAGQVRAPTLVLHRRGQRTVPVAASRGAAALIPDARLVVLEGTASFPYFDAAQAVAAVRPFLDEGREPAPATATDVQTILFTDITSSTALTQRLGDAKAQELVRAHNAIVREALAAHGGREIKHTGDGIMASFNTPSRALDCAVAVQRAVAAHAGAQPDLPLGVHVGLNAGEPVAEEGDIFGTAVQLARRICDQAAGGEILASNVVRELAAGKGFLFADRGDVALRGFEDPVRLYEVRWRES